LQVEHQKEIDKYYDSMPKKEGKVDPKAFALKTKEYIEKHGLNFNPHRYATKKKVGNNRRHSDPGTNVGNKKQKINSSSISEASNSSARKASHNVETKKHSSSK